MNANFEYLCYGLMAAWLIVTFYVILLGLRESKLRQRTGSRAPDGRAAREIVYWRLPREFLRHVRQHITHHRQRRNAFPEIVGIHFVQRIRLSMMPIEIVQPD